MTLELQTFNQLYTTYRQGFIRFARSYVRDEDVAEDFVTDSMIYYWENRHSLANETTPPAYILTVIKSKCLNYLEHLQTRLDVAETLRTHAEWELSTRIASLKVCDPEELFSSEIQEIVTKTLQQFPAKTREIFLLSREENLTYKEIASMMGMSDKGVEFHISKALKLLRIALKDYLYLCVLYFEL